MGKCYVADTNSSVIDRVACAADTMIDRWLGWLQEDQGVPVEEREALRARDLYVRRSIAETDPANVVGEKLVGKELTKRLVEALWGGQRKNPPII